ncbi:cytochrome P450 monooxygenase CYP63 [Pluteus cervinus]|uniref:Cytochrome P450 monooxygenase CYP63 n=1 Tax=Pluteus cervinus TaxID=181527 RepID=A0ACD3AT69_9AGAR|nr:cytochrome P450 monooxygenase CYP63 [Pluteus cervinus]
MNPANYRARLLLDIVRAIAGPFSLLYLFQRVVLRRSLGPWTFLLYAPLILCWNWVSNIHAAFRKAREASRLGARPIPQVVGKWPGNIDVLLRMMRAFKTSYVLDVYLQLFQEYKCTTLNLRILWVDAEHSKFILATGFQNFWRGKYQKERMETFLGEGIFNRDDERWKMHRDMARPFFARERISDFDLFERYTSQALSILASEEASDRASEVQDLFSRFSLDAASEFLFGKNLNTLASARPIPGKSKMGPKGSATDDSWGSFAQAFEAAQQNITNRGRIGRLWPLFELFGDRNVPHAQAIQAWLDPLVQQALEDHANEKRAGINSSIAEKTFLQHLVESTQDPILIRDQLLSMLLASRDTTACVLTFVTYILAMHPEIAERLRTEVVGMIGTEAVPTYEQLRNMRYLRAVINETLRLFPPVPLNVRESRNECAFPRVDPTYRDTDADARPLFVPANTTVVYLPMLMQRNPSLWGPDAEVFNPERWLKPECIANFVENPTMFAPFSAGPRICIGQNYAYNQMSYFLVRMLQRFESFSLAPQLQPTGSLPPLEWKDRKGRQAFEKVWPSAALTLYVKGGLWVYLKKART